MEKYGLRRAEELFSRCASMVGGDAGFLAQLRQCEAYGDPLGKKSFFYLSLASAECGWTVADPREHESPVDYHEVRGHLRLGTVKPVAELAVKIAEGKVLTRDEDLAIRSAVQSANETLAARWGASSSQVHVHALECFSCLLHSERSRHTLRSMPSQLCVACSVS